MASSLYPAAVVLNYHSAFGAHKSTIPTLPYSVGTQEFDTWNAGAIDAVTMVQNLVDVIVPFYPATVAIDSFTVLTYAAPGAPGLPQFFNLLGDVGTNPGTGWTKATQVTFSLRTTSFGRGKLVLLDAQTEDNWDKITNFTGLTPVLNLIAELTHDDRGWAGRDNAQYVGCDQITYTLNEALRRNYNMT